VPGNTLGLPAPLPCSKPSPLTDLALPHHAQALGSRQLPPLCGLRARPLRRGFVRISPDTAPAARDAADWEHGLWTEAWWSASPGRAA
jgi:hypothetical protein